LVNIGIIIPVLACGEPTLTVEDADEDAAVADADGPPLAEAVSPVEVEVVRLPWTLFEDMD
jgi:hypothetical protein